MDHLEEYRVLCDAVPIGLWRTSIADGEFLLVNQECAHILGYDNPKDLIGQKAKSIYEKGIREEFILELYKDKSIHNFEALITRKDGSQLWVSINARMCLEKGYIEGSIQDVSAKKSLEIRMESQINCLKQIQEGIKKRLDDFPQGKSLKN